MSSGFDNSSNAAQKSDTLSYAKVVFGTVEIVPGKDGLAFSKKFKAQVPVEIKDTSATNLVKFRQFCVYKDVEYEITPDTKKNWRKIFRKWQKQY